MKSETVSMSRVLPGLLEVHKAEQRHAEQTAKENAKLAEQRQREVEKQDQWDSLREARRDLKKQIAQAHAHADEQKRRMSEIDAYVDTCLISPDARLHETMLEYSNRNFMLDRVPSFLAKREAMLAAVEKELALFCATNGCTPD